MIIRAVSSDDDENDDHVVGPPPADASSSLSASAAVKLAWVGVSLALTALLLLDLSALLNQFFPASDALAPSRTSDPFSVLSLLLLLWRARSSTLPPATALNNLLGQLFVCAWIYSREKAMTAQRQRYLLAGRGSIVLPRWIAIYLPGLLVVMVLWLGHLISCVYILLALFESHGGSVRTKFWLGRSSIGSRTAPRV